MATDYENAKDHVNIYYQFYKGYTQYPCLSAYKAAYKAYNDTLTKQNEQYQAQAFWAGICISIAVAGITGGLGTLFAGAIGSRFTKYSSIVWAGNKSAQDVLNDGAVDLVKQVVSTAGNSPVMLLAQSVNSVDLMDSSVSSFEDEDKLMGSIDTEHGKTLEFIKRLSGHQEKVRAGLTRFNVNGLPNVGLLEKVAYAMTGSRTKFNKSEAEKDSEHDFLKKRFELAIWWHWIRSKGIESKTIYMEHGMKHTYKADRQFSSLPPVIQNRIKELTSATGDQLNQYFMPHFNEKSGQLNPGQSVDVILRRFASRDSAARLKRLAK